MKSIRKVIAIIASVAIIGALTGCQLISKTPEGEKKTVVAKINNKNITKGEFEKTYALQTIIIESLYGEEALASDQGKAYLAQMKPQILDTMIQQELMTQKAKELKITLDDKTLSDDAQKQLDGFLSGQQDKEKINKKLADKKLTMDDLKNLFKSYQVQEKVYQSQVKDVTVSDDDAKKYYNENLYQYTEKPNVMNVSQIIVKTQKEAEDIKAKLDKGEKFEDLAKQYNIDGTKETGGSLGDIQYTDTNYDKDFMFAALALPEGKISTPVKSQFGFHLIRVNKKTEYPAKAFDTVKQNIKDTLIESKKSEKFQSILTEWEGKAKITKYPEKL